MKFWSKITFNYGYILDFVGNHSADVWLFKLAFESVCEVGEGFHKLWGLEPKNYMTFICNHKIRLISYCSDSSVRRMTLGLYFQPPNPFPTHFPTPPRPGSSQAHLERSSVSRPNAGDKAPQRNARHEGRATLPHYRTTSVALLQPLNSFLIVFLVTSTCFIAS